MAITWKILGMDRLNTSDGRSDVIKNVFWYCSDSDSNGNYGYSFGNQQLEVTGISDDDFTDYSSLTEAQVIQWVKDALTADELLEGIESGVTSIINDGTYTLRSQGVPW